MFRVTTSMSPWFSVRKVGHECTHVFGFQYDRIHNVLTALALVGSPQIPNDSKYSGRAIRHTLRELQPMAKGN